MGDVPGAAHSIRSLHSGRDAWRLKVRVIRLWEMCPVDDPIKPYAIQLVLVDSEVRYWLFLTFLI